jgi:hypothetical protein
MNDSDSMHAGQLHAMTPLRERTMASDTDQPRNKASETRRNSNHEPWEVARAIGSVRDLASCNPAGADGVGWGEL